MDKPLRLDSIIILLLVAWCWYKVKKKKPSYHPQSGQMQIRTLIDKLRFRKMKKVFNEQSSYFGDGFPMREVHTGTRVCITKFLIKIWWIGFAAPTTTFFVFVISFLNVCNLGGNTALYQKLTCTDTECRSTVNRRRMPLIMFHLLIHLSTRRKL